MIRSGAFLLKKLNLKRVQGFLPCTFFAFILIFLLVSVSCKSAPLVEPDVQPVDLIDSKSSFYLRIPTSVDSLLLETVLASNFPNMSQENIKRISSRIDTIYIGLNRTKKGVDWQISLLCNFPKIATDIAFSKKKGWEVEKYEVINSKQKKSVYEIFSKSAISAAFPSEKVACFGRDIPEMLEKYHELTVNPDANFVEPEFRDTYEWLSYEDGIPDNEIHFYASRPQSFLTVLIGAQLNYQLDYIRGKMFNDSKNSNQYIMELEFEFKDRRIMPAAKGAITLALGLTDSEVRKDSDTHLTISNIKISKKQLYQLLSLR